MLPTPKVVLLKKKPDARFWGRYAIGIHTDLLPILITKFSLLFFLGFPPPIPRFRNKVDPFVAPLKRRLEVDIFRGVVETRLRWMTPPSYFFRFFSFTFHRGEYRFCWDLELDGIASLVSANGGQGGTGWVCSSGLPSLIVQHKKQKRSSFGTIFQGEIAHWGC